MALHYIAPASPPWKTEVSLCSGLTGEGIPELWKTVERFYTGLEEAGVIAARRQQNRLHWMGELVTDELLRRFRRHHAQRILRPHIEKALLAGEITAVRAAHQLLDAFDHRPASRPVAPPSSPEAVPPGQA
jgi:LAO/AO transport system kinase